MPMLAFRLAAPKVLVDIGNLHGLKRIDISDAGTELGALVTWRDIERDARLVHAHPLLAAAIAHVAHYQIRNRGTVGGSLAHADPAAEMLGVAVACDAVITVVGAAGRREIAASEFCLGALTTVLACDEVVVHVRLPHWKKGRRWAFEEFSRRRGDFALAGVAAFYDLGANGLMYDTHLAVLGAGDRPTRLSGVEALLDGKRLDGGLIARAADVARDAVDPADDIHAEAAYRRDLVGVLVERTLARAGSITIAEAA
jgi:carbon-monoxide dehydrogenase medium subunit